VRKKGREYAISIQHQEMGGTAEQKIANHLVCLGGTSGFKRKYLVLGGDGWSARANNRALNHHITNAATVRIIPLDRFVARARARLL
jgi:hypothetical protein